MRTFRASKDETGMALLLVLMAVLIFGATVIMIYSGHSTQGNVSSMVQYSEIALIRAEDGLNMAIANLNNGTNLAAVDGTSYTTDDGWQISVNQVNQNGNNLLAVTATQGRYSRTVATGYTFTPATPGTIDLTALNQTVFTEGNILFEDPTILNNNSSFYANGNIDMTVFNYAGGTIFAGGEANVDQIGAVNQVVDPVSNAPQLPFPEVDFEALRDSAGQTVSSQDIGDNLKLTSDVVIIEVNSSEVNIPTNFADGQLGENKVVAFVKADGYTGDYTLNFNGGNINNCNFFVDGGKINFDGAHINSKECVIYTNYEGSPAVYSSARSNNFQIGSLISKGDVHLTQPNYDGTNNAQQAWQNVNNIVQIGFLPDPDNSGSGASFSFAGWREL